LSASHDVCFVGLKCYDLLVGAEVPRYLGGVEKQLVALAHGMVEQGMKVAFITYDHGQQDIEQVDGITIIKSFAQEAGLPGLRFLHPRMTVLWSTMKKANAAFYIQMGSGSETGQVAMGCRGFAGIQRKFVFCVASDADCVPDLPFLPVRRERTLYRYGLKRADLVISQTASQQKLMSETFAKPSKVIAMPFQGPLAQQYTAPTPPDPKQIKVLWVGRIIDVKRLEWLLDVAEQCPDDHFDVIGTPNSESGYSRNLITRAADIRNVTMHGRVAEAALPGLFKQASVLCCTSVIEGFPTTFMEAWSYGIPVVTTFDPDNVIARKGLGKVVQTVDELVAVIAEVSCDSKQWQVLSERVREYYLENHTLAAAIPRFIDAFSGIGI